MPKPISEIKLSVLVPVFNWDIGVLIHTLVNEIVENGMEEDVEVHFYDDGSDEATRFSNRSHVLSAATENFVASIHEAPVNKGRSTARNELVRLARGDHLLFLDADVIPDTPDFLQRYIAARHSADAVCGGISYKQCRERMNQTRFYLRYSSAASVGTVSTRMSKPWAWLYTANVLVSRATIERVPFDSEFQGYGYEDLEWGLRVCEIGSLLHIDNPVTHMGLLSKQTLSRKTGEAALNLVHLWQLHPDSVETMGLVRLARRVSRLPLTMLRVFAAVGRWAFLRLPGPYAVELALFQCDKVLRSAIAFRLWSDSKKRAS